MHGSEALGGHALGVLLQEIEQAAFLVNGEPLDVPV